MTASESVSSLPNGPDKGRYLPYRVLVMDKRHSLSSEARE